TGKRARRERHHRAQADLNDVPTDDAALLVVLNHGGVLRHAEGGVVVDPDNLLRGQRPGECPAGQQSMSPLLPALAARRWPLWCDQVGAARSGDLCPVLPEAVPDFEISI